MSWKTTVTSIIAALSAFVMFAQQGHYIEFPMWVTAVALFTFTGGLAAFGITAKDSNVTGGDKGQPSTPEALHSANQEPSTINPPKE
jgi:hypothetical protein